MPEAPDEGAIPIRMQDRFAVELESVPADRGPRVPPDHELFRRYRLYRVSFQSGDQQSYRYRLGFLPSRKAAEQARQALLPWYPEARVVPTSQGERAASAGRALSAEALRSTAPPELPVARQERARTPRTDDDGLLARGRAAMTGGDLDLAIRLFTAILTNPESPEAPDALELLGLARERRGQLAHAKAEYENYLARYPGSEGADRVRQRLDALLTRSAVARPTLRPAKSESVAWDVSSFGSLYTSYYRSDLWGAFDETLSDSVAFTDLDVWVRARREGLDLRARGSGSYRYDIPLDSSIDEFRLSSLYIEGSQRDHDIEGAIGRQSANSSGLLGRFDGLRLGVGLFDGWKIGSVAGFPVELSREPDLDTDRIFTGISLDTPRFLESIEGQVWAIGQQWRGLTDRAAVGGELRYFAPSRFFAGFVDYDVYFGELNSALLIGNWTMWNNTSFHITLDHRTTPTLTLQNALIGQPFDSLRDLQDGFSNSEIQDLAADRTARSSLAMLGMTRSLTEKLQLNTDATVSKLDGTSASGGVPATEGTGLEYGLGLQLLANDTFLAGDVTTFGLRGYLGDFTDSYSLDLGSRLPVGERLYVHPLVLLRYEDRSDGSNAFGVQPGLRADWSIWKLHVDGELTFEWGQRSGGPDPGNEYGYRAQLGLRYDFR
jgi:hypothetical protein